MCINGEKACIYPTCPVTPVLGLKSKFYCTRGSEKAQRYEHALWGTRIIRPEGSGIHYRVISMVMVTKRDGRQEQFVEEKIVVSMVKSGAPADFARTAAAEIGKNARDGISSREIRTSALGRLRAKNPAGEKNWLMYDAAVKKRSG